MKKILWYLEVNCISDLSPNHTLKLTTLRTAVSKLLQLHFKCFCGDSLSDYICKTMVIMACSLTLYTTKIRGMKFSPIALLLYWGKIFVKFNFANRVCSTLQKVVDGARAYRIKVVLYSSISHCYRGRRQLTQQGPRKIGQISRCSAKMLED